MLYEPHLYSRPRGSTTLAQARRIMALTQKQLDEFANERVGDNFKILPDVLGELEREREQLALRVRKSVRIEALIRAMSCI